MKIDFLAEARIRPRREDSFSIKSRCSFNSSSAAASKMFAADPGRSNVSTQIWSPAVSRRIIGSVATVDIKAILATFGQMRSGEVKGLQWRAGIASNHAAVAPVAREW